MKNIVLILAAAAFFAGCASDESRAKKLIREYMKASLKDPSSYEPISFGVLDSLFSPYIVTEEGRLLFDLGSHIGEYGAKSSEYESKSRQLRIFGATLDDRRMALDYLDSAEFYNDKMEAAKKLFEKNDEAHVGEFCGWLMTHKFRAKNSFGGVDVDEFSFFFNKEITSLMGPYGKRRDPGTIPKHAPL